MSIMAPLVDKVLYKSLQILHYKTYCINSNSIFLKTLVIWDSGETKVTGFDSLSLMRVKVGNIGFDVFIFICISKIDFQKQKW